MRTLARWPVRQRRLGRGGFPAGVLTCPELFRVSEHPASRTAAPARALSSPRSCRFARPAPRTRRQRAALQQLMRDEAIAAVEQACGRRVRLVMSDIAPDDDAAIQLFLFEPDGG